MGTTGWTRADGSCDCVGLQITDSSSQTSTTTLFGTPEEETSTALPMTSNSGRRLRRELLEMERKPSKSRYLAITNPTNVNLWMHIFQRIAATAQSLLLHCINFLRIIDWDTCLYSFSCSRIT